MSLLEFATKLEGDSEKQYVSGGRPYGLMRLNLSFLDFLGGIASLPPLNLKVAGRLVQID